MIYEKTQKFEELKFLQDQREREYNLEKEELKLKLKESNK